MTRKPETLQPHDPPITLPCGHTVTRGWLMSAAAAIARASPGRRGRKPHGHHPAERASLEAMRNLRVAGKSYDDIAVVLNHQGHRTRNGLAFTGQGVCKILKREGFVGDARTIKKDIGAAG